jgi:hypothetical protein
MNPYKIIRQIDVFDKDSENLIEEIIIEPFDLELMKSRFEIQPDDPLMYYQYEIDTSKADIFPYIKFDFTKNLYFVATYQEPIINQPTDNFNN